VNIVDKHEVGVSIVCVISAILFQTISAPVIYGDHLAWPLVVGALLGTANIYDGDTHFVFMFISTPFVLISTPFELGIINTYNP
jgi:hypothetical protein